VVFAGDIIFRDSTPMGWVGTYDACFKALDLIISLNPKVIVPGHGPVCGVEGAVAMKDYFHYVRDESKKCFDEGLSSLEAAKRIDLGPYAEWKAPARLYINVTGHIASFATSRKMRRGISRPRLTLSTRWPRPKACRRSSDSLSLATYPPHPKRRFTNVAEPSTVHELLAAGATRAHDTYVTSGRDLCA